MYRHAVMQDRKQYLPVSGSCLEGVVPEKDPLPSSLRGRRSLPFMARLGSSEHSAA
jgi:hypothetical protein